MMELPHNMMLYLVLLAAVAAGFLLGRRERPRRKDSNAVIQDYYEGLNFLLSDRPELGVDQFIRGAEVSDQTIDVHLAMASVVRRRGEVDKAIRIHQNLLASPVLNNPNKQLIELELARDYHVAGLLDRAENLLLQIVGRRALQESAALELLLDLYEQERAWQQAIDISARLLKSDEKLKLRVSHFYCELAETVLGRQDAQPADLKQAAQQARSAVELAPGQVRGHWLAAQIAFLQRRDKQVLKHISRAVQLQGDLVAVFLPLYQQASERLSDDASFEQFLQGGLQRHPQPAVLRAWIAFLQSRGRPVDHNEVLQQISRAPQLAHLPLLLSLLEQPEVDRAEVMAQVSRVVVAESQFQCGNCGFASQHLMWHCPTCRQWGTFAVPAKSQSAPG